MLHETSSWHAEVDLRVFGHLHRTPGGRANITPSEALGIRTDLRSVAEVVARIHYMLEVGWLIGVKNGAGVRGALLAPGLSTALAEWRQGKNLGDTIRQVLDDADAGRPVDEERLVGLRDEAVFYC